MFNILLAFLNSIYAVYLITNNLHKKIYDVFSNISIYAKISFAILIFFQFTEFILSLKDLYISDESIDFLIINEMYFKIDILGAVLLVLYLLISTFHFSAGNLPTGYMLIVYYTFTAISYTGKYQIFKFGFSPFSNLHVNLFIKSEVTNNVLSINMIFLTLAIITIMSIREIKKLEKVKK
jgi:hypothetical protein